MGPGPPVAWLMQAWTSQSGPLGCLEDGATPQEALQPSEKAGGPSRLSEALEPGEGGALTHLFGIRHELSRAGQKPAP